MSTKKIVITGGAGFVGTNLIKYFLEKTENPKKLSKAPKKYFIDIGDEYSHYNWNAEFVEYRYKSNGETVKEKD